MKKMLAYLCVGVMVLGLAACSKTDGDGESQGTVQDSTGQSGSTDANGSQEDTEGTGEDAEGTGDSTPEEGTTSNTVNGHNYEEGWTEEMETVKTAVVDALGDSYWPDTAMLPDVLEMWVGVTPDLYEDYLAESPMISTNVDTLIVIKAKEDTVEKVMELLLAYRESKVNDTMQYPMNIGKIQASRVERIGNYVCFVQLGGDTSGDISEEDSITKCQEANELVIEVISKKLEH